MKVDNIDFEHLIKTICVYDRNIYEFNSLSVYLFGRKDVIKPEDKKILVQCITTMDDLGYWCVM